DQFFQHAGGTSDAFLQSLYKSLLGRDLDAAGTAFFTGELSHGIDRTTVAEQIATSHEADRYVIRGIYKEELGRAVDPSGLDYWDTNVIDRRQRIEDVEAG